MVCIMYIAIMVSCDIKYYKVDLYYMSSDMIQHSRSSRLATAGPIIFQDKYACENTYVATVGYVLISLYSKL